MITRLVSLGNVSIDIVAEVAALPERGGDMLASSSDKSVSPPRVDVEHVVQRLPRRWLERVAGVVGRGNQDALSDVGRYPGTSPMCSPR